jgi:succinyl-CoA synthetase alpha subunit
MAIFLTEKTKVIVQGITGSEGSKHTRRMILSGTNIVGGVTPGKGGQVVEIEGKSLPVFNSVKEAVAATGADASVIFVPPKFAKSAVIDAIDAQLPLIVVITEGIPITPADITGPGSIGLVSKSGTLTYQMMYELRDIGFTTAVGIGGDPIVGTTHIDCLRAFQDDPETKAIVMIGEIGGDAEERAAAFIKEYVTKPVVGYVAGFTAPEGKTMGHAGAIVSGSSGTAEAKKVALEAAGVKVGKTPSQTAELLRAILKG